MKIERIEFDDPDDPKSSVNSDEIRIRITPEGMAMCIPNAKSLTGEDQKVLGQMLRLAYQQGKDVGKQTKATGS